jgi:hypothetical protein
LLSPDLSRIYQGAAIHRRGVTQRDQLGALPQERVNPLSSSRFSRRLTVAALAIALPGAAIVYTGLPSEAATLPAAGGTYQLAVAKSGKCIDVTAGSKDNSALLQ